MERHEKHKITSFSISHFLFLFTGIRYEKYLMTAIFNIKFRKITLEFHTSHEKYLHLHHH